MLLPDDPLPDEETRSLLRDGRLTISADASLAGLTREWMPLSAGTVAARGAAHIQVLPGAPAESDAPAGAPAMRALAMAAWLAVDGESAVLRGEDGLLWGTVDLPSLRAQIHVAPGGRTPGRRDDVFGALVLASAMLLGRLGHALLHAAAVVAPDGRAWLLAGDSFSGKTSTCVNLIRAGWNWLSDDQVVVHGEGGEVWLQGWPRRFTLDDGFRAGESTGTRTPTHPEEFGPGRLQAAAPLAGLLLPRVQADQPTILEPVHGAEALGALIRQSPWLLADRAAAGGVLRLLTRAAHQPSMALRLGLDSYRDPAVLRRVLSALPGCGME